MEVDRKERTYVMVKPDGVHRGLVGEILKRFENRGYKLVALKMCSPTKEHVEKHYADLAGKKFFAFKIIFPGKGHASATNLLLFKSKHNDNCLSRNF